MQIANSHCRFARTLNLTPGKKEEVGFLEEWVAMWIQWSTASTWQTPKSSRALSLSVSLPLPNGKWQMAVAVSFCFWRSLGKKMKNISACQVPGPYPRILLPGSSALMSLECFALFTHSLFRHYYADIQWGFCIQHSAFSIQP